MDRYAEHGECIASPLGFERFAITASAQDGEVSSPAFGRQLFQYRVEDGDVYPWSLA
jgi:hypothetical protein